MSNDDSCNDCEELLNLYSSKKITDTFKAQLKKIAASNQVVDKVSIVDNEETCIKRSKETPRKKFQFVKENQEAEILVIKCTENSIPVTQIDLDDNDSLEDSIQIISEVIPRATRRSNRLKEKRQQQKNASGKSHSNTSITIGKKASLNSKRNKRKDFEQVVVIEDSPPQEPEEELNPELSVKVIWKSVNIKKFQIRKFQKLSYIFEKLSKEENIPEDKIMLTFNNVRVNRSDTPDSLNLQVYHFLDGGVLSESSNLCQTPKSCQSECDSDSVTIKFQDSDKKIIKLNMNRKDKLKVGMIKCSEQLEIPLTRIKFYFDGELLDPSETPESLGLENDEVVDIKIF